MTTPIQCTWYIDIVGQKVVATYRNHNTGFVHEVGNGDIETLEAIIEWVLQSVTPGENVLLNREPLLNMGRYGACA